MLAVQACHEQASTDRFCIDIWLLVETAWSSMRVKGVGKYNKGRKSSRKTCVFKSVPTSRTIEQRGCDLKEIWDPIFAGYRLPA